MRRILVPVAFGAVLLTACAGGAGPQQGVPYASLSPGDGLDQAAARGAVADFLHAYADAPGDRGAALQALAGSPWVARWAHLLAVQNAVFPGTAAGKVVIGEIGPAVQPSGQSTSGPPTNARQIDLRATVSYTYTPTTGQPLQTTHSLNGPIVVAPGPSGTWGVVDFSRDGTPLSQLVFTFPQSPVSAGRVQLRFDTAIVDQGVLEVEVAVGNGTAAQLTVGPARIVDASGNDALQGGTAPVFIPPVPAGARTEGLVLLAQQALTAQGLTLEIPFLGGPKPVVIAVSLDRLLGAATQVAPPTVGSGPAGG